MRAVARSQQIRGERCGLGREMEPQMARDGHAGCPATIAGPRVQVHGIQGRTRRRGDPGSRPDLIPPPAAGRACSARRAGHSSTHRQQASWGDGCAREPRRRGTACRAPTRSRSGGRGRANDGATSRWMAATALVRTNGWIRSGTRSAGRRRGSRSRSCCRGAATCRRAGIAARLAGPRWPRSSSSRSTRAARRDPARG